MAGPSRIDELRKKFDENPRRYFAPLANEYRKLGDFDQAIFICQEFLPQQPGHMSGHIVYGQALFEAGRHDEARTVFETALALDPENLIALRHLGDIARAHGDNETARAWYRRVLESDPRNEEIAGILSALDVDDGAAATSAKPSDAASSEISAEKLDIQSAMTSAAPGLDSAPAADPIVDDPITSAPAESTFDELAKLFTSAEPPSAPAAAVAPADDSLGLIHEGEDVLGRAAEMHAIPEPDALDSVSAGRHEEEAAQHDGATFSAPFLEALGSAEPPATEPAAPEPIAQAPAASESMAAASPPPIPGEETADSRQGATDPNAAFVTETMAELYLRQGHHELAVDVYRKLVALRPEDTTLRARLEELERPSAPSARAPASPETSQTAVADAGPTIREFLASIAEFRPRSSPNGGSADSSREPPPVATKSAASPNDAASVATSLHSLFLDAEAPPTRGDAPAPVAPPRPAADLPLLDVADSPAPPTLGGRPATPAASELSLDHVFRHATPAAGAGAQPSSFSFDQFFSQQAHHDVSAGESESTTEASGGASDDIQQFNAWLEGLKKT